MAVWTVFEPDAAKDGNWSVPRWAERLVFVREKFSWTSLILAPLVLLRHRLWLAFVVYLVAQALIGGALAVLELDPAAGVLGFLPNLLVALSLPDLRRRKLAWRGYDELGAVVAPDLDAAERRFLSGWLASAPFGGFAGSEAARPALRVAPSAPATPAAANPVLGLFPEARGR